MSFKSVGDKIEIALKKFFDYFSENLKVDIRLTYNALALLDMDDSHMIDLLCISMRMMERKYNYFSDMVCLSTKEYEKLYYFTNKYIKTFHTDFNLSKEILFSI